MKTDADALSLTRGQRRARTFYAAEGVMAIAAAVMVQRASNLANCVYDGVE